MASNSNNENFTNESLILLYINKNPFYYSKINSKLFEDKFLQRFYSLCRAFYKKFQTSIFDNSNKSTDQIRKFVSKHKEISTYDPKLSTEENVDIFIDNVKLVFRYDLSSYSEQGVQDSFRIWLRIRAAYVGIIEGVEAFKRSKELIQEYNLLDIEKEVIRIKKIMNGGFDFSVDDDDGDDILDRKIHLQPNANELFPVGWKVFDRWNSGQDEGKGGFEPGTTTYIFGAPNSGKSVFLWNIAYNMWYYGANVLGVSLEMSSHKIAKRIGANAFGVDIGSYAKFSENELQFNEAVKRFKGEQNDGMGFNMNGSMRLKRYGSANVDDIYKLVKRIEDRHGYKLNALVLDYATELQNSSGLAGDKTYSYHKENTNELYALGVEENIAVITGHQLHVRYKGMEDVSLQMAAESTGITQRPDLIYGLIQSPNMRVDKKFACKLLKGRDTGDVEYRTEFGIDWKHMRLTPYDNMIDPAVV